MSGDENGEKPSRVGKGAPPKAGQFPPKTSGNPKGRPVKRKLILVKSELRRTTLKILDEKHEVTTPSGVRSITAFEALLRRLVMGAIKGNPTQLRIAMPLITAALSERVQEHRAVQLADLLQDIEESSPTEPDSLERRTLKAQLKQIEDIY